MQMYDLTCGVILIFCLRVFFLQVMNGWMNECGQYVWAFLRRGFMQCTRLTADTVIDPGPDMFRISTSRLSQFPGFDSHISKKAGVRPVVLCCKDLLDNKTIFTHQLHFMHRAVQCELFCWNLFPHDSAFQFSLCSLWCFEIAGVSLYAVNKKNSSCLTVNMALN